MTAKTLGAILFALLAAAAALGIAYLLAPDAWLIDFGLKAEPPPAPAKSGWGAKPAVPAPAPMAAPLIPLEWMAWTNATGAFFLFIGACLCTMTAMELARPGGNERRGALGLVTTRGDRLFITLLGSAFIFIAWVALLGSPLWGPLGLALLWGAFVFWRV